MGSWTDIEGPIHRACLAYLRTQFPDGVIHHSANENPMKGRAIARAIAKNKLNGMLPGYPDLVLHWRGMTMGFEVKGPKGALTDAQKAVRDAFSANSIPYAVVSLGVGLKRSIACSIDG